MEDMFDLIDDFECTIDKRIGYDPASKVIFEYRNQQAEKWSSILNFLITKVTLVVLLLPPFVASFFVYFGTDLGNEAFMLPFPVWIPFDWKNPVGYCMVFGLMYITVKFLFISGACMMCLGVSVFLILLALIEDARIALKSMKSNVQVKSQGLPQQMEQLLDFINRHLMARKGVHDASNISQPFSLVLFIWSVVTTCSIMLMLQIELSEVDSVVILQTILFACYSFGILFVACEIGNYLSTEFIKINETFKQIDWYLLPIEIQRILPKILMNLQEPVELFYFGGHSCSRESMKKVYNKGFSYFMTLRKLDK